MNAALILNYPQKMHSFHSIGSHLSARCCPRYLGSVEVEDRGSAQDQVGFLHQEGFNLLLSCLPIVIGEGAPELAGDP